MKRNLFHDLNLLKCILTYKSVLYITWTLSQSVFEFIRAEEWSSWNILRGKEQAITFWEPLHSTDCRCHLFSWQVVASSIEHSIANSIIKHCFIFNYVCGLNGRWQLIEIAQVIWHIDCGLINVISCMHTLSPVYFKKSEERWYQIKGNCTPFGPNHLKRPERDSMNSGLMIIHV
jgi:hypothetical protein